METTRRDPAPGSIRMLFEVGTVAGMSDGQLLDRFLARRPEGDEAAEVAFAALVERHGPTVLRICRGRLGDEHDAQDAFQATFFILARKARSIRGHESAASWLHGVARRVASCARRAWALRRAKERQAAGRTTESAPDADRGDLTRTLREEMDILPEKYRTPLVLCLLDGLTHEEAAIQLDWPVGTVKTRVRRAKDRLRTRLARRGLAPSLAAIGAALASAEASAMPAALVRSTVRDAPRFAMASGATSASVAALVELGLGSLLMNRLKVAAMVLVSVGVLAAGATGLARPGPGAQEKGKPSEARSDVKGAATVAKPDADGVADSEELLERKEAARLDIELLQMEVTALKQSVSNQLRHCLQLKTQLRDLVAPPVTQQLGGSLLNSRQLTDEQLEDAKKQGQRSLDYAQERLASLREEFLAKSRVLRGEQRRLKEIEKQAETDATRATRAGTPLDPQKPGDLERRLSDVERKLDLILKALEGRGR